MSVDPRGSIAGECVRTHSEAISHKVCQSVFTPERPWQRFSSHRAAARRELNADRLGELPARVLPDDQGRAE